MPVDHYVYAVARLERDCAVRLLHLVNRHNPFHLVSEIDDDFGGCDFDDAPLQQLAFRRRREMTVVFYEMFVVLFNGEVELYIPFICARHAPLNSGKDSVQTVEESVLQQSTGVPEPCQQYGLSQNLPSCIIV